MKYLIITVAGTATRFNRDTKEDTLKCLYYEDSSEYALLSQILKNCGRYDRYIIVGGYLYEKLKLFIDTELSEFKDAMTVVYNEHYMDYGSGYSLYKGIKEISEPGEVTFVEGDLFFKAEAFKDLYHSKNNVISINQEPIYSNKAVVLYINENDKPRYLYDTNHHTLIVPEPFKAIFNSGQMWKFISSEKLVEVTDLLTDKQIQGTNLEIIQAYFGELDSNEYEIVTFSDWFNCNTVADYNKVRALM